jgi:peptidoglycan/LPS O-acetylase OafA/YrhL
MQPSPSAGTPTRPIATRRIATLDGWRGVAILLVLVNHAFSERFAGQAWVSLGSFGVDIFFVLSGFIITARLLEERAKTSTIHLRSFYLRRAFRILPPVLVYLTVLLILSLFLDMDMHPRELLGSLFFYRNYQIAGGMSGLYTEHFWSLSIEEQFYLFWPLLLIRLGNARATWTAAGAAVLCATWRLYDCLHPDNLLGRHLPGATPGFRMFRTDERVDGLLLGCVLALLFTREPVRRFIANNFPKETPLLCAALIFINLQWSHNWTTLTTYVLLAIAIASTLQIHEGLAYKWLNSRLLTGVGLISYSLYIWQELFLMRAPAFHPMGVLSLLPLNFLCAIAAACLSYFFIEQPAIRLGRRFEARHGLQPALSEPVPTT